MQFVDCGRLFRSNSVFALAYARIFAVFIPATRGAKNPIANCNFSAYVHARLTQTAAVMFMCSQLIEKSIAKVHFTQKLHFAHKKSSFLSKAPLLLCKFGAAHKSSFQSRSVTLGLFRAILKMGRSLNTSWSAFTPSGSVSHCSCNCFS